MRSKNYKFDTLQVHAGHTPDKSSLSRAYPIYQTTSYVFKDADHAEDLFALKEPGNIYTRINNPTTAVLEERLAALDGGIGALVVSSGSSAITYAILNIASVGDEIIASNKLYGGTFNLFSNTLPNFGIKVHFVDPSNPENFTEKISEKTKALFIESIANPNADLVDIEAIAHIAHEHGLPLIVDNTVATPYLLKPIEYGADIVVYSITKFIGGHGTSIGGAIIDSGRFDWKSSDKFPSLTEPDPGYHGLKPIDAFGAGAYIAKARVSLLRDMGAAISPFNAFLLLIGIETLSLRMEKHVQNALALAQFLDNHPKVAGIHYPSLSHSKNHALAQKYFPKGAGAVFSFEVVGDYETAKRVIDKVELFSHLANIGDAKSLIIHPASTTHQQLSEEQLLESGIKKTTIRLSVGIEDIDDLKNDLDQALN